MTGAARSPAAAAAAAAASARAAAATAAASAASTEQAGPMHTSPSQQALGQSQPSPSRSTAEATHTDTRAVADSTAHAYQAPSVHDRLMTVVTSTHTDIASNGSHMASGHMDNSTDPLRFSPEPFLPLSPGMGNSAGGHGGWDVSMPRVQSASAVMGPSNAHTRDMGVDTPHGALGSNEGVAIGMGLGGNGVGLSSAGRPHGGRDSVSVHGARSISAVSSLTGPAMTALTHAHPYSPPSHTGTAATGSLQLDVSAYNNRQQGHRDSGGSIGVGGASMGGGGGQVALRQRRPHGGVQGGSAGSTALTALQVSVSAQHACIVCYSVSSCGYRCLGVRCMQGQFWHFLIRVQHAEHLEPPCAAMHPQEYHGQGQQLFKAMCVCACPAHRPSWIQTMRAAQPVVALQAGYKAYSTQLRPSVLMAHQACTTHNDMEATNTPHVMRGACMQP